MINYFLQIRVPVQVPENLVGASSEDLAAGLMPYLDRLIRCGDAEVKIVVESVESISPPNTKARQPEGSAEK